MDLTPSDAPNGVYVYTNDNKLFIPDIWDIANNNIAIGIAVITDNCRFAVGKTGNTFSMGATWSNSNKLVNNILTTQLYNEAILDYAGVDNTEHIINAFSSPTVQDNAAYYCSTKTITVNGHIKQGYLGALGEMREFCNNQTEIEKALLLLDNSLHFEYLQYLWTSTQYNKNMAWCVDYSFPALGDIKYEKDNHTHNIFPLYSLD